MKKIKKIKWKVALQVLPETDERVWIVHNGLEEHKDYLGRTMKFNTRENAEEVAKELNDRMKDFRADRWDAYRH